MAVTAPRCTLPLLLGPRPSALNGGTSFGIPPYRTPSPGQGEGWGGGRRFGRALNRERARSYGWGWGGVRSPPAPAYAINILSPN